VLELAREQIHEQTAAPGPVRRTPVLAHDADGAEADLLVGADRTRVVGGRVDREPVVAALLDQVPRERPYRVGSEALSLMAVREEEVDPGVAEVRLVLLHELDEPHDLDLALGLDRERFLVAAAACQPAQVHFIGGAPPTSDARLGLDLGHPLDVV
jgi:hypothetical protein